MKETLLTNDNPSLALWFGLIEEVFSFTFSQTPFIFDKLGIEKPFVQDLVSAGLHGATGGIFEELNGGQFGHGFLAAGLPKTLNLIPGANKLTNFDKFEDNTLNTVVRTSVAATVGGTVSRVTGGKFANGAVTAGFSWLLNFESSRIEKAQEQQGGTYSLREGLISAGGDREAIEAAYAGIAESFPAFGLDDKLLQTIFPNVNRSHPAYIEGRAIGPTILFAGTTAGYAQASFGLARLGSYLSNTNTFGRSSYLFGHKSFGRAGILNDYGKYTDIVRIGFGFNTKGKSVFRISIGGSRTPVGRFIKNNFHPRATHLDFVF